MEHKKHDSCQALFNLDIVEIIDKEIQRLTKEEWNDDDCLPVFSVSLNNEDVNNQSIMLTIEHLDSKFTWKLFPRNDAQWGYDSVLNLMVNMYNRTM